MATALRPTPTIAADTADWRGRADPIVRFWTATLEIDPSACVLRSDLYAAYAEYMRSARGKPPIPETAFPAHFGEHDLSRAAGVRSGRPRNRSGLSLRPGTDRPKGQAHVWQGIRFKAADQGECECEPG